MPTTLKHLMRLGTHGEKKYFKDFKSNYDAIIINANMIAHTVNSMSTFLGCELSKPFIIDPQTYAFQSYTHLLQQNKNKKNLSDAKLKKSFQSLINKYGEFLNDIIVNQKRSIKSSDFVGDKNSSNLENLCQNVLAYQQNTITSETTTNSEYSEYIQYELENCSEDNSLALKPEFLIAPYFYMTRNTYKSWIDINIESINKSKQIVQSQSEVYAQIVMDKDILLDSEKINDLCLKYKNSAADGFLIWLDKFDEKDVSDLYLDNFIQFLKNLKAIKKTIYQIYGSYFSIILTKDILSGVCHGMEYGENRDVYPVGGGVPVSKFYYPALHKRLLYRDALDVLLRMDYLKDKNTYFENVCNCRNCHEIINIPIEDFSKYGDVNSTTFKRKSGNRESTVTMDYPTTDAKDLCLRHYLYNKINEFKHVEALSYSECANELNDSYNQYYDLLGDNIDYLNTWYNIISRLDSSEE